MNKFLLILRVAALSVPVLADPAGLYAQQAPVLVRSGTLRVDDGMLTSLRQIAQSLERSGQADQAYDLLMPYREDLRVLSLIQLLFEKDNRQAEFLPLAVEACTRDPLNPSALVIYLRALHGASLDDSLKAVAGRYLEKVDSASAGRYELVGNQYQSLGLTGAALDLYEKGRRVLGDRGLFRPQVAELEVQSGHYDRALKELFPYFSVKPGEFQVVQRLLYEIMESGPDGGRLVAGSLEDELRRADGDYRNSILRLLIDVQLTRGEKDKAFQILEKLARGSAGNIALNHISIFIGRALKLEDFDIALRAYDLADSLKVLGRDKVLLGKATLYSRMEKYKEAQATLLHLVELDPPSPLVAEAMNSLGDLNLNQLGQPDKALEWYRRLEAANPAKQVEHSRVKLQIVDSFIRLDRLDEARGLCLELLDSTALNPGLRPEAIRLLADVTFFSGNPDSASTYYLDYAKSSLDGPGVNDAIERSYLIQNDPSPGRPVAVLVGRALHAAASGMLQPATGLFQEALAVTSDSTYRVRVSYEMGKMYERAAEYPLAAAVYQDILNIAPAHYLAPAAELRLSLLLLDRLGDREGARRHLENIVFKRPEGVVTPEARRLLRSLDETKL